MVEYGEPLKLHELNIEGLVEQFYKQGKRTDTSKIQPLHPAQLEIVHDPGRFKVVACGRRFGKSLLCAFIASTVVMQPGRKVWIVSATYKLTDKVFNSLYHLFVNELKLAIPSKGGRANRVERLIQLPNGSTIEGKSCERRDQLVGDAIDLLIFDEYALVPNGKDIFDQELRPTLMDREGSAVFISTPRGRNHFYSAYLRGQEGMRLREERANGVVLTKEQVEESSWSSFRFDSYANTTVNGGYLKKSEVDSMMLTMPGIMFRQECLADFTAIADTAFPEFESKEQVTDWDFQPQLPVDVGMDFNYQTPCTTLYLQIDPNMNILVFDEYHPLEAHKSVHEQAQQMLHMDHQFKKAIRFVAADKSGEQKALDGRSAWLDLEDYDIFAVGKKQKIETGCDLIRLWCKYPKTDELGNVIFQPDGITPVTYPKLFIHKRCKNLIFALETARAPENQQGMLKEGYQKDNIVDGPLDALRYILVYLLQDSGYVKTMPVV